MIQRQRAYIFIGPPGSGKGSLSRLCIDRFGWTQLSTGNLCRMHIADRTEIGKQIDFTIKSGKLISDELITDMVDEWLEQMVQGVKSFILDGFPRNLQQVQSLFSLVEKKYPLLELSVIRFVIPDEIAIDRICNRYICQNKDCQAVYSANAQSGLAPRNGMACDQCDSALCRRRDDTRETVMNRLKMYRDFEIDILDSLQEKNKLFEVDVDRSINEIFETFKETVIDVAK